MEEWSSNIRLDGGIKFQKLALIDPDLKSSKDGAD